MPDIVDFTCGFAIRRWALALVFTVVGNAVLAVSSQEAQAEVKTLVLLQNGEMCPYMRPLLTPPKGWIEENSTCAERLTILVPKGSTLGKGPAAIYGRATANRENLTIEAFVRNSQERWKQSVADALIVPLGEVERSNGQGVFKLFRYRNPNQPRQPVELGAFTLDTDDKGNGYRVMIMLTATSEAALNKVEAGYRGMLAAYKCVCRDGKPSRQKARL